MIGGQAVATSGSEQDGEPRLAAGVMLGRYVVLGEIGRGGMGIVYAAHDPELDRRVAVKLLRARTSGARLVREARALARLAHPSVVTVYDVGTFEERAFVAMELIEGESLRRWMEARARPWIEAALVFVHAGRGLAAAHAAGLVHRDFKPENVLIGPDGRVRVLDFGLVSDGLSGEEPAAPDAVSLSAAPPRLTATGALLGTPAYMAPEQIRAEEADARTDQWSYCLSLWEAVYGGRPFRGETLRDLARAVTQGTLPAPPQGSKVPEWLRRALARGLAVDRDARHPSMNALLADLDAGLAREEARAKLVGRRYELIPEVPGGAVGCGERAVDRITGAVVSLIRVGQARREGGTPSSGGRLALTGAVRRLASLRHPNIAAILDFGFDDAGEHYFVFDHRDVTTDAASTGHGGPSSRKIEQVAKILRALAYLHRHDLVHGAIAPDAVLVSRWQTKLLPLGAEVAPERVRPAYTAPEVARGGAPGPASDLYAVGVLAYELFASHHPCGGGPPRADERPDLAAIEVEPAVAPIVGRLLEADPARRYATAEEALAAIAEVAGPALAADTVETRESFLRAGPLVGRDAEVARLHAALRDAREGRGSAWLVGGESGVGKSRLLDEVRAMALAESALLLRGQAEREDGGPYRLFHGPLRRLALLSDLDELEAGVLLPVVPDLATALRRPVDPAPELDAPSVHARLREVVERLLRRQEQPLVLLLEDLQWSQSDSLKLLAAIHLLARSLPLLVVATYRNDERPALREELAGMETIDLARLPDGAIADLSAAMIGAAGRRPEVVRLLARETEGNAFFVVEVVRALAESAGGLHRIDAAALPEKVLSGGIRRVVERRLRQVPEPARALLRVAAVVGRVIDPQLCAALAPGVDVGDWVVRCVEAAVLEPAGEEHRFAHDKLREGLLAETSEEERKATHLRVAEAIEGAYAGAPERYAALAHHFGRAGDEAKEARYAALAGEVCQRNGAWKEGRRLLQRALVLSEPSSAPALEIARIQRGLAELCYLEMDFPWASLHARRAIEAVGSVAPGPSFGRAFFLLWQLLVQVLHLLVERHAAAPEPRRQELLEASHAASLLSKIATYDNDQLGVVAASLAGMNAAEQAGGTSVLSAAVLGYCAGSAGLDRLSRRYFDRVHAFQGDAGDLPMVVDAQYYEVVFLLGKARLDEADALSRRALALTVESGDTFRQRFAESFLGSFAYHRGSLDEAAHWCGRSVDRLDPSLVRNAALFTSVEAPVLCALGRAGEAHERLNAIRPWLAELPPGSRVQWWAVLALVHVARGDVDAAVEAADHALAGLSPVHGVAPTSAAVFDGVMAACLGGWRAALAQGADPGPLVRKARRALRLSFSWSRLYPLGRPQALLDRGRALCLSGRPEAARRSFQEALDTAIRLGLGRYEGLARRELQGEGLPEGA